MAGQTFSQNVPATDPGGWTFICDGPNSVVVKNIGPETIWLAISNTEPSGPPSDYPPFDGDNQNANAFVTGGETSMSFNIPESVALYAGTYNGNAAATFSTTA
jgi:hypothetical protein